ncbi:MAG: hypothetical protein ACR2HJ_04245 [Fimbriimonadales bacterium]
MYQIAPLAMNWASAEGRTESIIAVGHAIEQGPTKVRQAAVHAVRCWLLGWDNALRAWTPGQIALARAIFRSSTFRTELHHQALIEPLDGSVLHTKGIQMPVAVKCLAIVGDARARGLLFKHITSKPQADSTDRLIQSFAYVKPTRAAVDALHRIIYWTLETKRNDEYASRIILTNALSTLASLAAMVHIEEFIRIANDRNLSDDIRPNFIQSIGFISAKESSLRL